MFIILAKIYNYLYFNIISNNNEHHACYINFGCVNNKCKKKMGEIISPTY
nr:MAG TPA: hypothetical protein [Caudoviricetes sp.]